MSRRISSENRRDSTGETVIYTGVNVIYINYAGSSQPGNALERETILHARYYIGNVIGQGGFGITYVGWDLTLEMKVAIKEYFPSGPASRTSSYSNRVQWDSANIDGTQRSTGMNRFLKEVRRMARLDDVPSIVRVRDAFEENETAYIVMDFVEGNTLKNHLLGHGVMSYQACMNLLSPLLDSLAIIHDHGFIHRDISPDNIMLQPDGQARLLDMGVAVDVKANDGHASMAVIKRNFSAPEQYMESETLGSWTDVYAMGATIYYCMTGKVVPEALEREFKKTPLFFDPSLNIPPHAVLALNDALALNAENRIQNMRELKRRLAAQREQGQDVPDINPAMEDFEGKTAPVEDVVRQPWEPRKNAAAASKPLPDMSAFRRSDASGVKAPDANSSVNSRDIGRKRLGIAAVTVSVILLAVLIVWPRFSASDADTGGKTNLAYRRTESRSGTASAVQTEEETQETEPPPEINMDFNYEKREGGSGITLTEYTGGGDSYIRMPSEIDGLPVVELGENLFEDNSTLEKVILPEYLEYIASDVFNNCTNLQQVVLPSSLRSIYVGAFRGCTSLQQLELPEGLAEISLSAFDNTGLKELTIPFTVNDLDGSTGILSIEGLKIARGNRTYKMIDGVIYNNEGELTDSPNFQSGKFVIPPEVNVIGFDAFLNTSLTELVIPGNVKKIDLYAISESDSLQKVEMEEGVEELGMSCFSFCGNLTEVTIPRSVKMIDMHAFSGCDSLKSVTISRDCQIHDTAFGEGTEINYYD